MANLKGKSFSKQKRDANFRLAAFKESKHGTNSHKTHSNATRVKRDSYLSDFSTYAEDNALEGKLNLLMDEENLTDFLTERLDGLAFSTQEDYLRGFSGMVQGLAQANINISVDVSFFNTFVSDYKETAIDRGESFNAPKLVDTTHPVNEVIGELSDPFNVIAQLQYETGYRVSEAYEVIQNLEKYLDEMKLKNVIGKGGQAYRDKIISLELKLSLLKLHAQQVVLPHQSTYYRHLQVYGLASHDLRAYYAKELYEEKRASGNSHVEASLIVSKQMNHHRPKITEYYLSKFATQIEED